MPRKVPCKRCSTLYVKRQYEKHNLCKQCNNLRRHPPSSQPTIETTITTVIQPPPTAIAIKVTPTRTKRPYYTLGTTQRWERRKQAKEVLQGLDVPIEELNKTKPSPAALIHLPKSVRDQIRTVEGLHIPCEEKMVQCKYEYSNKYGTQTATFNNGAYITDPIRFVSSITVQSKLIIVGGDCGGGHTKLGITYTNGNVQTFAALLVYNGKDNWNLLSELSTPGITPFTGDSEQFPHIFTVLQHFIDHHSALLNGDWPFINTLLGLKNAAAIHPCPICITTSTSLLRSSRYRQPSDKYSQHQGRIPLISILPERIVPTPLHLFLGISNRIILDAYIELFGETVVIETIEQIKTVNSAGCGGLSDTYQLNGPEITKWLKKNCCSSLISASSSSSSSHSTTPPSVSFSSSDIKATHSILSRWLRQLHDSLLHSNDWKPNDIDEWRGIVDDIQQHWQIETKTNAFPKLHMLRHTVEFAERHRFLGRASEAQIEL